MQSERKVTVATVSCCTTGRAFRCREHEGRSGGSVLIAAPGDRKEECGCCQNGNASGGLRRVRHGCILPEKRPSLHVAGS